MTTKIEILESLRKGGHYITKDQYPEACELFTVEMLMRMWRRWFNLPADAPFDPKGV